MAKSPAKNNITPRSRALYRAVVKELERLDAEGSMTWQDYAAAAGIPPSRLARKLAEHLEADDLNIQHKALVRAMQLLGWDKPTEIHHTGRIQHEVGWWQQPAPGEAGDE